MNENKNNQEPDNIELRTPEPRTTNQEQNEDQSFEETLLKIKPYVNKLLAKKKQFLIFNGIVAILAVLYLLFITKPYYTSTVSILPEYGNQSSMLANISGLASLAGINVGDIPPNEIYKKILVSEKVIKEVVYNKYLTEEYRDSVNLIEYFEIESSDDSRPISWREREKFLKVYKVLVENRMNTDIDRITTVLSITIEMPESQLSAEVANTLVSALNDYITNDRQSYAREQSEYLFNRINEVRDSLRFSEDQLKVFRENNRAIKNSPQLTLEQNRLIRKVEIAQSVFLELTKQYELIKLEEVKDTPVVNIMEKAESPVKKAGPNRIVRFIIFVIFSTAISLVYILFVDDVKKYVKIFY